MRLDPTRQRDEISSVKVFNVREMGSVGSGHISYKKYMYIY